MQDWIRALNVWARFITKFQYIFRFRTKFFCKMVQFLKRLEIFYHSPTVVSFYRAGGSCWKMGVQFTFLPLTQSIFDGFWKFFFLLKSWSQFQFVKKWVRNCAPCASSSASPVSHFLFKSCAKSYLHWTLHLWVI